MLRIIYILLHFLYMRFRKDFKIILIIFFIQFVVLLPATFWDTPWTLFFKYFPSKKNYKLIVSEQNTARLKEASQYFNNLDSNASLKFYDDVIQSKKRDIDLVVSIVTTKRKNSTITHQSLGYLKQTIAKIDKLVKLQHQSKSIFTVICNVDKNPSAHDGAAYLKSYLPYVERFGTSRPTVPDIKLPNSSVTFRNLTHIRTLEKETFDYMFCLKAAKYFNPRYVLVLEDDGFPHSDLFDVIFYMLKHRLKDKGEKRKFVHLKLFYPDKWQGYAFESYRMIELISAGLFGGGLFLLFYVTVISYKRTSDSHSYLFLYSFGVIFTILTCLVVGRQNMMELRRLHPSVYRFVGSPKCCTPAMLFPTDVIDELVLSLSKNAKDKRKRTDLAIAQFVEKSGIPAYHIEPNLAYHIGTVTSLGVVDKPDKEFIYNAHI